MIFGLCGTPELAMVLCFCLHTLPGVCPRCCWLHQLFTLIGSTNITRRRTCTNLGICCYQGHEVAPPTLHHNIYNSGAGISPFDGDLSAIYGCNAYNNGDWPRVSAPCRGPSRITVRRYSRRFVRARRVLRSCPSTAGRRLLRFRRRIVRGKQCRWRLVRGKQYRAAKFVLVAGCDSGTRSDGPGAELRVVQLGRGGDA